MRKDRIVIGVGGNIGAGKTTVAKIFQSYGVRYISADKIGRNVLNKIGESLKQHFGNKIFSGKRIDREKLRNIVFSSRRNLKILNKLSHPLLLQEIYKKIDSIHRGMIVIDAALLFDWDRLLNKVDYPILVKAPLKVKRKRAQEKGIPGKIFCQILKSQKKESEMAKRARFVIKNDGGLWQLKKQCQRILKELKNDC